MLGAAESFSIWDKTHFWTSKHKIVHMTNSAAKPGAMQHSSTAFLQYRRCERCFFTHPPTMHIYPSTSTSSNYFLPRGSTLAKKRKVNQPRVPLVHWAKALWSKQSSWSFLFSPLKANVAVEFQGRNVNSSNVSRKMPCSVLTEAAPPQMLHSNSSLTVGQRCSLCFCFLMDLYFSFIPQNPILAL